MEKSHETGAESDATFVVRQLTPVPWTELPEAGGAIFRALDGGPAPGAGLEEAEMVVGWTVN